MSDFIDAKKLYFLQFDPIYMQRIWGGDFLSKTLHRDLPELSADDAPFGESWEVSDREDAQSVVKSGALAGKTLRELIEYYGESLLGALCPDARFPLLVKFIDAGQRLSLQVHPDEAYCREAKDGAEPKTEMWYIADCGKNGEILAGLAPRTTRDQFMDAAESPRAADLLQRLCQKVRQDLQSHVLEGAGRAVPQLEQIKLVAVEADGS